MESKEESINLLKMRMHQHMDLSSGKEVKPENIQYYVASFMQRSADIRTEEGMRQVAQSDGDREIYRIVYEKLQNGESLSEKENKTLSQKDPESYRKAKDIEQENEEYRQKLKNCRTKEDVQRAQEEYRRTKALGLSMTENDAEVPVEKKREYTLFKDAKISAIKNITRQFTESEEYKRLPTDEQYIRRSGELPPAMEGIKVPETMDVQHERAKNEYEKVLHSMDEEELYGFGRPHWLNIKG